MAYVEDRLVYDAGSHIPEPPGYAEDYADPSARELLREKLARVKRVENVDEAIAKQRDPEFRPRTKTRCCCARTRSRSAPCFERTGHGRWTSSASQPSWSSRRATSRRCAPSTSKAMWRQRRRCRA